MVVMESVSDREVAAALAAQKTSWYDPSVPAEEYLKASNNSYFSQMSQYHGMAHSQHGKEIKLKSTLRFSF
jgi:hypothetical protein